MTRENERDMALASVDLNETDTIILDYLRDEGRATPAIMVDVVIETRDESVSRSYVNQRLVRLNEHGYITNVRNKGVYEIKVDPREE